MCSRSLHPRRSGGRRTSRSNRRSSRRRRSATRTSKSRVKRRVCRYRAVGDTTLRASYNYKNVLFQVRWNDEGWRVAYTTDGVDYREEIEGIVYTDTRDAMLVQFYPKEVPPTGIAAKDLVLMLEAAMHYVHVHIKGVAQDMTIRLDDASTYPSSSNVSLRAMCEVLDKKSFWEECGYSLSYVPQPPPPGSTEAVGAGLLLAMERGNADKLAATSEAYMQKIHGKSVVAVTRTVSNGDKLFGVSVDTTAPTTKLSDNAPSIPKLALTWSHARHS